MLERFLRREEALRPGAEPVHTFTSGKGDKLKEEPVYRRADVERCLTAESWHKEGRRPKAGESPLKLVPVRAVTITRKREAEEHERVTGEKQMQGLYSWDQSEYIIPPPIVNGVIPKNAYGNMDCFVPSMVPKGAAHIPLKGTIRICKKLEIDFAEAVTGFEFGNKRAVPVCTGVVVAKEHEKAVREAWREYNEAQKAKEEKKLEAQVLETWRKFVIGLRIRERVRDTYGEAAVDELGVGKSIDVPILLESEDDRPGSGESSKFVDDEFSGIGGFLRESDEEHVGSDLEVGYHPNDDRRTGEKATSAASSTKGKPRATEAEEHYPTPSSVSPLKPAVRGERLSQSTVDKDEDAGMSDLSSVPLSEPGGTDDNVSDFETDTTPATIEKHTQKSPDDDLDDAGMSDEASDQVSDEEDEDKDSDFHEPLSSKRRGAANVKGRGSNSRNAKSRQSTSKSRSAPTTPTAKPKQRGGTSMRSSTRRAKESASPSPGSIPNTDEEDAQDSIMARAKFKSKAKSGAKAKSMASSASKTNGKRATATPKRRTWRRDSTIVTSPYFDGEAD